MTRPRFVPTAFVSALVGTLTVLQLPACTQDITPPEAVAGTSPASPSQGALFVVVAPTAATSAEEYADALAQKPEVVYHVLIDGKVQMGVQGSGITGSPIVTQPGYASLGAYYDAGVHHIELAATDNPTVFAVDGMITSGALTRLYVFGPRDGLQARFESYPLEQPAGAFHVAAINLVRAGAIQIEVVSCTDAATCTPVSPPLSLGDTFDTDISNVSNNTLETFGYGYRQVATPSLPMPPVIPLNFAEAPAGCSVGSKGLTCTPLPFIGLLAAPIYLSGDGTLLEQVYD
jgi:hypothetical protein